MKGGASSPPFRSPLLWIGGDYNIVDFAAFSSLDTSFRNFNIFNQVLERVNSCGNDKIEVISPSSQLIEINKYCDNKICQNPDCKIHREYKYKRYHSSQIELLNKSIRSPKAWVFTGWVKSYPIDRDFCRSKFRELFKLLSSTKFGSVTHFSIHMEVKLRESDYYLHFHCVLGGLRDYRMIQKLWGRYVRYEYPIHKDALASYVSKYASKTPILRGVDRLYDYFNYIYKTQTSRFSCGRSEYKVSGWYLMSMIEREVYFTLKSSKYYSPFVDGYKKRNLKVKPPPNLCDFGMVV